MHDYDASFSEVCELERDLNKAGVTKEQFNLDNLAGATYREMKGMVDWAIKKYGKKAGAENVAE